MKLVPLLLAGSLVANTVLCFFVAAPAGRGTDSSPVKSSAPTKAGASAAPVFHDDHPNPETWTGLTGGDTAGIVAHLREEGFPPSLQRAILAALITERFADRHKALAELISAQPWWRGGLYNSADGAKILAARQQLQRDEKDALDQLLGPDAGISDYARARKAHQYGDLTAGKGGELDRINADYNELIAEVRTSAQNILLPEDRAKLAYLEKEKRDDIAKLLTPDELFAYDLRSSPTANQLRNQLTAFSPTEDEFRAIFKVQQAFDARFGSFESMTAEQRRERGLAQADLTKQIEAVLPPDRYAEYKEKTDQAYLSASAVVTRLQLPPIATADIVAIQKDISKRADAVRTDRALTPDQRTSQLTALGSEAVVRLNATLGDAGVAAYKQNGGYWINNLQRPPTLPAAPAPKP